MAQGLCLLVGSLTAVAARFDLVQGAAGRD